jgi:hypothetical protein
MVAMEITLGIGKDLYVCYARKEGRNIIFDMQDLIPDGKYANQERIAVPAENVPDACGIIINETMKERNK